jgi:hypothetical protein
MRCEAADHTVGCAVSRRRGRVRPRRKRDGLSRPCAQVWMCSTPSRLSITTHIKVASRPWDYHPACPLNLHSVLTKL